jgi:5-formyltetrahydrofolate cyclo-ligase
MSDQAAERRAIRLALRERRSRLQAGDQREASIAVMAHLAGVSVLRSASIVSGYRSIRGEIDIDASMSVLREAGSVVTVPRVVGDHLEFLPWHAKLEAVPGPFGIEEPVDGEPVPLLRHDVVLAPLVAFDSHGHRLGQGGGYYDRALGVIAPKKRPIIIGIAHSFQQVERVPSEAWDVPLDAVITDEEILEFRPGALDAPIH